MSLKNKALELNSQGGVPFMEGRTKADQLPVGSPVTITEFGFIKGEDGDYVVLGLKEDTRLFYFGGTIVTDKMKQLEAMMDQADKDEIAIEGIPVLFTKKVAKKGKREYMTCEFYPVL
jgi:hypothetical protein